MCVCYLSGQQGVGVEALHVRDQSVSRVHRIIHKTPVQEEPIRAAVHRDAFWDFTVAQSPHVSVALEEQTVQALFTDEAETRGWG